MTTRIPRPSGPSRRTVLAVTGLSAASWALAACGDDDGSGKGKTDVEVFSWWTGGGEAAGLKAMVADFEKRNPDIGFKNEAVAGGAGTAAKPQLEANLKAGNPPDSFQGHAGAELLDYVKAGYVEDLTSLYDQQGWTKVFPATLLPLITQGGRIYSVPVNIHRANMLWSSPELLSAAGITGAPRTWDEFLGFLDKVKGKGKIPLSLGEQWTAKHLLETVLLGELGRDGYEALWKSGGDWGGTRVTGALDTFGKALGYTNSDAPSLTWQDAGKLVVDGKAAYNIMGDWTEGYYRTDPPDGLAKKPKTDYDWAAAPGTDGLYQFLSDSFTLCKKAPHRDAAIAWLKECGSKAGQDAFNPKKGSIPARSDADASLYDTYLQWALGEWKKDRIVGSLTHGVVASNAWNTAIDSALGVYLKDKKVARFQDTLAEAAGKYAA
ncbi:ABC transporter substrate-binding protein [Streptomyces sp. Act143]|uniref:ABC transporter substrate-binding protein n=1 Tax=Streptomyces sp. Act143 TaxID=2200760 RepID=UPI000D679F17|nr:extracellular solute-binding protein [Streptomyces sp. Act143]PWI13010.1 ABC transporter substrate-binding protein [Streptomyces sp. Act143]